MQQEILNPNNNVQIIGNPIGIGSHADIYKACWTKIENGVEYKIDVAVKFLNASPETLQKKLNHEAEIMSLCDHPNIIRFYGITGHNGLMMQYLAKGSLYDVLQNEKLSLDNILPWEIASGFLDGLIFLHKKNIIHCDLKSQNILLTQHYSPKISDFGSSRMLFETKDTEYNQSEGTIHYMAAELLSEKSIPTKASDIYSAGMVLWEISSRKIPFNNEQNVQILNELIKNKEIIPSDCPTEYGAIIEKCWKDPDQRPSASEIAKDLTSAKLEKFSLFNKNAIQAEKKQNPLMDNISKEHMEWSNDATFGRLGEWYLKYKDASWCDKYNTYCLQESKCEEWHKPFKTFSDRATLLVKPEIANSFVNQGFRRGVYLLAPSLEVHNKAVKAICSAENMIEINAEQASQSKLSCSKFSNS